MKTRNHQQLSMELIRQRRKVGLYDIVIRFISAVVLTGFIVLAISILLD